MALYAPDTPPDGHMLVHAPSAPTGFKAKRFRKTSEFIRGDRSRPEFASPGCSAVDMDYYDPACHGDRLLAGVARLVFRHIADTEREHPKRRRGACRASGLNGGAAYAAAVSAGKPTTEDFERGHFFVDSERPSCLHRLCQCFIRTSRREEKIVDKIFELLDRVFVLLDCPMELSILLAIYIEMVIESRAVRLNYGNWLSIVVAALLLASKVWEDICPWNSDFARILQEAVGLRLKAANSLYRLESLFMKALDWNVSISGETYASYLFSLRDADLPASPRHSFSNWTSQVMMRSVSDPNWTTTGALHGSSLLPQESLVMTMVGLTSSDSDSDLAAKVGLPSFSLYTSEKTISGTSTEDLPYMAKDYMPEDTARQNRDQIQAERARPFLQDVEHAEDGMTQTVIEDRWLLDKHNPFVGSFRHAQQAAPPSRHINDRAPRMAKAASATALSAMAGRRSSLAKDNKESFGPSALLLSIASEGETVAVSRPTQPGQARTPDLGAAAGVLSNKSPTRVRSPQKPAVQDALIASHLAFYSD